MKFILLTQGKQAIVDDEDYEYLSLWKWQWKPQARTQHGYASRTKKLSNPRRNQHFKMHRLILGLTDPKIIVDHINGNGLDNRRENLRIATRSQNSYNSKLRSDNTSGYRGVRCLNYGYVKKWNARIYIDRKERSLGVFATKEEAAVAYNKAAMKHYGEFAKLNPIQPQPF